MLQRRTSQRLVGRAAPSALDEPKTDWVAVLPALLAIVFATIVTPMLNYSSVSAGQVDTNRIENKIFWPLIAVAALAIASKSWSRIKGVSIPLHLKALALLLVYCGLTIAWSFKPQIALVRFSVQVMICVTVVLPLFLAKDRPDIFYGAFVSFAVAAFLNVYYIQINNPEIVAKLLGYPGFYDSKNSLGQFMGIAFILAVTVIVRQGGGGKALAIASAPVIVWCLYFSNSKTAFALAFISPIAAALIVMGGRITRLSPAVIVASIAVGFYAITKILGITTGRISYAIYKDSSFTGRTVIWDFLNEAISYKWLQGWGYGSFWQAGPDGPSSNAPGWVKIMPSGHSGYLDVTAEVGNVGLVLLLVFIFATLHAIGAVMRRDPARAWAMVSLCVYALIYNFLESSWLRSYEIIWVMFLIVAADAARVAIAAEQQGANDVNVASAARSSIRTRRSGAGRRPGREFGGTPLSAASGVGVDYGVASRARSRARRRIR